MLRRTLQEYRALGDSASLEDDWLAELESAPHDLDYFLGLAQPLANSGEEERARSLVELLDSELRDRGFWKERLELLKRAGGLATRPAKLQRELVTTLEKVWGGKSTFRSFLEYSETLSAKDYAFWHERRQAWVGSLRGVFDRVDLLACPSMFMSAPPIEMIDSFGRFTPEFAPFMRFTAPFNFSGSPTLSVPCGFTESGLPYSLQLVARHGEEALLCRAGHVYEQATDWHRRRPTLPA